MGNNVYRYAKRIARKTLRGLLGKKTSQLNNLLAFSMPIVRSTYPVLSPGRTGEWDEDDVHSHWIFRDQGGKYWMYYNGKQSRGLKKGIGLAESKDGIEFTKNAKNPLLISAPGTWESDFLWKCQVLKFGENDFRMWYGGHSDGLGQVGYAISSDGVNWEKYDRNPVLTIGNSNEWDSKHAENLRVIYEKSTGEFKGLYFGRKKAGKSAIGLAISPDGINWTKHRDNPVLEPLSVSWEEEEISPFHLVKVDDFYILFYEGRGKSNQWMIGVAYSQDLVNWYRDPRNPLIRPGFPGDFDGEWVSDPSVIIEPDALRLYYGCSAGNGAKYVGLAYLPLKEGFSGYFRSEGAAWNNLKIGAGDTTDGVVCRGYECEVQFISDVEGSLSVSVRQPGADWKICGEILIPAGTIRSFSVRDVQAIRLSFDNTATVTARYTLRRLKLFENLLA